VLYNLGVVYSLLGRCVNPQDPDLEELKLKDAIKDLQYAGWIFDKIRQAVPGCLSQKEISPDMTTHNLSFNSNLNLAWAQLYILELASKKNMDKNLQSQLAKGCYDLFTAVYNISKDALQKFFNEETRIYLNNRRFYYFGLCHYL